MTDTVQIGLEMMLAELQSSELLVGLVPCRRYDNCGGCIRVAFSKNAAWYRHFCGRHLSCRRRRNLAPDTRIKRANVERLLERLLAQDGRSRSKYAAELLRLAARTGAQLLVA